MPCLTVGKIRNMFLGKNDLESESILLLTNNISPEIGISSRRNPTSILRTLLNLRGFNMIVVGDIDPSRCTPTETASWKEVFQIAADVEIAQAKMRKSPIITNFQATPRGFLVQWDHNRTSSKTLRFLETRFNDYDSWGTNVIRTLVAPMEAN